MEMRPLLSLMFLSNVISSPTPRILNSVCGSPMASTRIVGGTDALEGEWPWQVILIYKGYFICGGSLITTQWVLSAAHCVNEDLLPVNYLLVFGAYKLQLLNNNVITRSVQKIVFHPQYTGKVASRGDIALLKLTSPVTYTNYILPVCLPSASVTFPCGMECWVTGWGDIRYNVSLPSPFTLQKVMAPLVDHVRCDKMYHEGTSISDNTKIVLDDMICAGSKTGQGDTCNGDSGGPLVCKVRGIWYQVGIVSWGAKCATRPSVYTLVTSYQSWIKNYIPEFTFSDLTNIPEPSAKCSGNVMILYSSWMFLMMLVLSNM